MSQDLNGKNKVFIEVDTNDLSPEQIRAIKTLNHMLQYVLSTDTESEFFDGSAEVMRLCASLIKQSNFVKAEKNNSIPYEQQALEFSLEVLQEHMSNAKVVYYDN